MDDLTFPLTNITQPKENLSLPHLVLDLGPLEMQKSSKQSDCCKSALYPSTQSNLSRLRASLLICNPSLPLLGVTVPTVTLACKVGLGLQDLQTRARRILAEKNAEKAKENMWIGRMVAAESLGELDGLIKSRAA